MTPGDGETETRVPVDGLSNRHTAGPSVGTAHPPSVGRRPPHVCSSVPKYTCVHVTSWQEGVCNRDKGYRPYERERSLRGPDQLRPLGEAGSRPSLWGDVHGSETRVL